MAYIRFILLICLLGCGAISAQTVAPNISASSCEKPEYPIASKRLIEEGTVQLKFLVGLDGKVIESAVEKSSGFRRLDEAARQGLAKCTFRPGIKNGVAIESWASMKYTWRIDVASPCEGSDITKWRSCLGAVVSSNGRVSVVEYEAGKKNGRGIEYDKSGNVIRSGIFQEENLVSERILDVKLYPFKAQIPTDSLNLSQSVGVAQPNFSSSNLPSCQGSEVFRWTNCFGTLDHFGGMKYVGEFRDGKYNGLGTLYTSNGVATGQGIWVNGKFTGSAQMQQSATQSAQAGSLNEDRLKAEVEAERKKRQELEQQLAASKERDRITADLDVERRKRQELEEQLRVAQQSTQSNNQPATSGVERRVALVIGNATYKINPLKNPVNDSTDMARSLRSVGFDVIEANNTTLVQMREATRRFADKLGNSDVGLVYYSGHGVEVKGKNYLIPVNADITREYEVVDQAFDASQFLEMMDNIRGPNNKRVNILIVDACRNNELQKSWRSTNNGLARMDAPGGTFISFATAPGRVAADGVGRNSPYTKHLLQALKQPNVPIEQVFKVVRRNVMEETKGEQIPWENSSLVGDFYFTVQR